MTQVEVEELVQVSSMHAEPCKQGKELGCDYFILRALGSYCGLLQVWRNGINEFKIDMITLTTLQRMS